MFPTTIAPGMLLLVLVPTWGAAIDLAEIKARGTIRVLAGTNEQPEMFSFEGDRPGFERELIEGFARLHRLDMKVIPIRSRDERIPALLRGDGDVLIGLVDTAVRRRRVDFTSEVLPAPHMVVTIAPHRVVTTVEELVTERVGVVAGASWARAIPEAGVPAERIRTYPDRAAVMRALRSGEVSATVISVYNLVLVSRQITGLQPGLRFDESRHSAWALRKEDDVLGAALDDYLENAQKSLSWSRLVVKYFGTRALEVLGRDRP